MPAPTIVKNVAETIAEKAKPVVNEIIGQVDPTGGIKESFAQMFGLPLPDDAVRQIREQDAATSGAQIAEKQRELAEIANNNRPPEQTTPDQAERTEHDTGLTHEEAEARLNSTLFHQAQQLGQTEENEEQRRMQQREKDEEEERLRKEQEEKERLATPISLPGGKRAGMNPTPNRASTGETLKNRDA